ncbi:hypothetical protein [Microbacterium sp. EST19A]|uniref:hypothetical protein n=1 Tax=Microbacterium sp. EST19A TaxID=2862681 RepID=UPI001CBED979|nr:hypothetical protein [Microbacterium sp. EST19A]
MSRGPGVWQRAILDRIGEGKVVILTGVEHTHAEQNAIRRAARKLADAGKLQITSWKVRGANRLVAVPMGMKIPAPQKVVGLDGKTYLVPRERPRDSPGGHHGANDGAPTT